MRACTYIHTHLYHHCHHQPPPPTPPNVGICVHACMCARARVQCACHAHMRAHARAHAHTHMHAHARTHAHTRTHARARAHTRTHTHIHTCRETEGVKEADPIGTCAHKSCVCIYTRARAHAHTHTRIGYGPCCAVLFWHHSSTKEFHMVQQATESGHYSFVKVCVRMRLCLYVCMMHAHIHTFMHAPGRGNVLVLYSGARHI